MMAQLIMNELSIKKDRERESERIKRGWENWERVREIYKEREWVCEKKDKATGGEREK
jgi:hypothetical protein